MYGVSVLGVTKSISLPSFTLPSFSGKILFSRRGSSLSQVYSSGHGPCPRRSSFPKTFTPLSRHIEIPDVFSNGSRVVKTSIAVGYTRRYAETSREPPDCIIPPKPPPLRAFPRDVGAVGWHGSEDPSFTSRESYEDVNASYR